MPNLDAAQAYLAQLDLGYVIDVMCSESYTLPRWTRIDAEQTCQQYKNFLWLNKKYPGQELVPRRDVDEFWHNHLLCTRRYVQDCLQIFGHYLHHEPTPPDADPALLVENYRKTQELYAKEFGVQRTEGRRQRVDARYL